VDPEHHCTPQEATQSLLADPDPGYERGAATAQTYPTNSPLDFTRIRSTREVAGYHSSPISELLRYFATDAVKNQLLPTIGIKKDKKKAFINHPINLMTLSSRHLKTERERERGFRGKLPVQNANRPRKRMRPDPTPPKASKAVASRFYQLSTGHALIGSYPKKIGKRASDTCWWVTAELSSLASICSRAARSGNPNRPSCGQRSDRRPRSPDIQALC